MNSSELRLLDGYTALDLTDLRGQFCGKCLQNLGMDVIKVEPPSGDPVRRTGPFKDNRPGLENSLRFTYLNAGKKSVTLDLDHSQGRELFLQLAEKVDVVLESFDPGFLESKGLGPAVLRKRNPKLVVTSVTGFGQNGPYRDFLAPHMVAFAMSGLMFIAGDPESPPVSAPETQGFYFSSIYAALGTLAALWRCGEKGQGDHVDVSVQETLATQEHLIRIFGSLQRNITRQGSQHPYAAPSNLFPTKDGYVSLFVSRIHWRKFLDIWPNHPPDFEDEMWEPDNVRRDHMERVNAEVSAFTRQFTKEEFSLLLQKNGIPCLPMNVPSEFAADPHIKDRELIQTVEHPHLGSYGQVAFPFLFDGKRGIVEPPPLLGDHTAAVLSDWLGLSSEDIQMLYAQRVI